MLELLVLRRTSVRPARGTRRIPYWVNVFLKTALIEGFLLYLQQNIIVL